MSNQLPVESGKVGSCCQQQPAAEPTSGQSRNHYYRPHADIVEAPNEFRIELDLPGAKGDEVQVHFEEGVLTIVAPVASRQAPDSRFLLREYGVADYRRSFQVSEGVDAAHIEARFAGGVLTLTLPKVQGPQPHQIAVNVG